MKKIPCNYKNCSSIRIHFTLPDVERGTQLVEVEDDYEGPAYCSFTCAILDGKLSVMYDRDGTGEKKNEMDKE